MTRRRLLSTIEQPHCHHRRRFLGISLATAATLASPAALANIGTERERHIAFLNLHTGERLRTTYWANGSYLDEGLDEINHILRDYRNDEVTSIDPDLMDILHRLQLKVGGKGKSFEIISGYRSPATNAMLRARSSGVAKRSLHMEGKAIDIRLPGCDLAHLRKAALSLRAGGVGYYPKSGFVHVDTGRVRSWG